MYWNRIVSRFHWTSSVHCTVLSARTMNYSFELYTGDRSKQTSYSKVGFRVTLPMAICITTVTCYKEMAQLLAILPHWKLSILFGFNIVAVRLCNGSINLANHQPPTATNNTTTILNREHNLSDCPASVFLCVLRCRE